MRTIIFLMLMIVNMAAFAGTGDIDKRVYVNWSSKPYTRIVYFRPSEYSTCTAQYVARDIILTARHCITHQREFDNYQKRGDLYMFQLYDGRTSYATLEEYGRDFDTDDWALLRINDPDFFSNDFFEVASKNKYLNVENAGFGYMRILSDQEISQLKKIFENVAKENGKFMSFDESLQEAGQKIREAGIPGLSDWDDNIPGYRLKADQTCRLKRKSNKDKTISTTCDNFGGNSGGVYFSGNTLYGICSKGVDSWNDKYNTDHAVSPELYYSILQKMKQLSAEIADENLQTENELPALTQEDLNIQGENLEQASETLMGQIANVGEMTDAEFFQFLGKATEYGVLRDNYERAKAREQSLANRMLSAAAIGAGGVGAMMLASGLAEQNADAAAEQDMSAYLATFRCDFGQGRNIKGGEKQIELPGANGLLQLNQEYKSLAADLKARKQALGLAPGIESEHISDTATTGLYDNTSIGRTDGAFTSLARALSDEAGDDAAEWAAQKAASKKKTTTGGIVGGVGVIGGAVGNLIINKNADKEDK